MFEFVNGKDDIPYMMETNKCLKHLETTNQIISTKTQKPAICSSPPWTVPTRRISCRHPGSPPGAVLRHEVACVAPGDPQTHLCDPGVTQLLSRDDTRDDTQGVALCGIWTRIWTRKKHAAQKKNCSQSSRIARIGMSGMCNLAKVLY
jgi:hypothetical protein